ncbi:DUF3077 domain-containing protein [Pseudomonas sp. EpS/L25]|uniref:DUF3077 domain-containing protein n=1 Tax=Pseudomonas sp. EpS/L25 TaxID=1749078 RepID=UPI00074428A5|nr:DUF3077 domain-containing protein [Pseudomonas sp. EpS/L25]KUM42488.1 hypothetical protein AR540_01550 [Pseudomonas sp. EpS/L25]
MARANAIPTKLTTRQGSAFMSTGHVDKHQRLLSVNGDIDAVDALETASAMLQATFDLLHDAGMAGNNDQGLQGNSACLVLHTLETVHALIDSVGQGLEEAQQ